MGNERRVHDAPNYPVVDPDPSLSSLWQNVRNSDVMQAAVISSAGYPFGYMVGAPGVKRATAITGLVIGLSAAPFLLLQKPYWRLMGFAENDAEVQKMARNQTASNVRQAS